MLDETLPTDLLQFSTKDYVNSIEWSQYIGIQGGEQNFRTGTNGWPFFEMIPEAKEIPFQVTWSTHSMSSVYPTSSTSMTD